MSSSRIIICPHCFEEIELKNEKYTSREKEVALLAAKGMSARDIGKALWISEKTVKNHLTSFYAKMELTNKLDLTKHFLLKGEIVVDDINSHKDGKKDAT